MSEVTLYEEKMRHRRKVMEILAREGKWVTVKAYPTVCTGPLKRHGEKYSVLDRLGQSGGVSFSYCHILATEWDNEQLIITLF